MLEHLFGNKTALNTLLYLRIHGKGHAFGIAKSLNIPLNMIQKQLSKFAAEGLLKSSWSGKTHLYEWHESYPLLPEIKVLLGKALMLTEKKIKPTENKKEIKEMITPKKEVDKEKFGEGEEVFLL